MKQDKPKTKLQSLPHQNKVRAPEFRISKDLLDKVLDQLNQRGDYTRFMEDAIREKLERNTKKAQS
jgi:hypothetical protein